MERLIKVRARSDIALHTLTTLLTLAFPAVTLFINRGDSYTLGLLALIGLWVWFRDGAGPWLDRHSGTLVLAFALFFAVAVLSYLLGEQTYAGFRFLGRYLRFLLVAPVYLAFRRYSPGAKSAFIGFALGALVSGALAILQFLRAHGPIRVEATTDLSIIFGDLVTTMVLCIVAGFGLMSASRRSWSVPLLIVSLGAGIAATLLSGTRGAWIPLLLLPIVLMTPLRGPLKRRYLFAVVLILVAVFSSFYFLAKSGTEERFSAVAKNLRNYFIALDTAEGRPLASGGYSHCDNRADFLNEWLRESYFSARLQQDATVTRAPQLGKISGCTAGYALRLHNASAGSVAVYVFHRMAVDPGRPQHTEVIARGTGEIAFDRSHQPGDTVDTVNYRRFRLMSRTTPGNGIIVSIPPLGSVWLAPIDSYFGEYTLPLADTSVGQRFELWRAAWDLFRAHPVWGVGTGAFQDKTRELIEGGMIATFVGDYDHPHNDYLDALSSRGIIGFAALLGILLIPAGFFMRAARSHEPVTHAVGFAGMLSVAGYAIYALTDAVFLHSMMITWYVIYAALFYALLADRRTRTRPEYNLNTETPFK